MIKNSEQCCYTPLCTSIWEVLVRFCAGSPANLPSIIFLCPSGPMTEQNLDYTTTTSTSYHHHVIVIRITHFTALDWPL